MRLSRVHLVLKDWGFLMRRLNVGKGTRQRRLSAYPARVLLGGRLAHSLRNATKDSSVGG